MKRPSSEIATPLFIAFFLVTITYLCNNVNIDFADEGFLWCGARYVLNGQVPILDFLAYDPGRYYWCAAVMAVFGKGLMSLRLAAGLFQFLGLSLGLLALRRTVRSPVALAGAGLLAVFFMLLPCRYFNASLPLIALFFAVRLVEIPSVRRHVEAGVCTGLIAFIAINHGFYVFLAFASLIIYLHTKDRMRSGAKNFFSFLAGTGLGLVPWLYFFAVVPGFFKNYWERLGTILSVFGAGKLRVSEPMPWPWLVSWKEVCCSLPTFLGRILEFTNRCSIGVIFIFVIVYYLISVPVVMRFKKVQERPQALFVASVFIGVFYLGHMFSRSNFLYLGEGIFPVVTGVLSAAVFSRPPFKKIICIAATLFMTVSFFSAGLLSNIIFKTMVPKEGMTWYPVGKDRIWLTLPDVEYCDNVKKLVAHYVKPEEPVLLAPLLTTFYCLLDKESPVYELHFHIPAPPDLEKKEIRQLEEKKVRWAIVADFPIGGLPELAMSNSHPLLWRYLMEHFEFVTSKGLRPGYFLMRRKPLSL